MGRVTNNYRLRTEGMTGSMRRRAAEREIAASEARHREDMAAIERHKKATGQVSDPAAEREAALKRYKERSGGHVYQYKEETLDEADKSPSEWAQHFSSPTYKKWIKTVHKTHGEANVQLHSSTHGKEGHAVTYASTHSGQKFAGNFHHTTSHGIVMGKDGNLAANITTE